MAEPVRFLGRQSRLHAQMDGAVGTVHPLALSAMQQTGEAVSQKQGRG